MRDELLGYYERELVFLRRMGGEFARKYPKIAARLLLDEEVDEVTAPGELGEFGVLPNHIAFLSTLVPGEMSYKQGGIRHVVVVSGGYAEVLDNIMAVLAPAA